VGTYVLHYNGERLHGAIGYVTPKDKLEGRQEEILSRRDQRLELAREKRRQRRAARPESGQSESSAFLDHRAGVPGHALPWFCCQVAGGGRGPECTVRTAEWQTAA
jgi:hypothetical protein